MMDYEAFWRGFVLLFIAVPFALGGGAGAIWAWRKGWRGPRLLAWAIFGGVGLCLCVFAGAVLFFSA